MERELYGMNTYLRTGQGNHKTHNSKVTVWYTSTFNGFMLALAKYIQISQIISKVDSIAVSLFTNTIRELGDGNAIY